MRWLFVIATSDPCFQSHYGHVMWFFHTLASVLTSEFFPPMVGWLAASGSFDLKVANYKFTALERLLCFTPYQATMHAGSV